MDGKYVLPAAEYKLQAICRSAVSCLFRHSKHAKLEDIVGIVKLYQCNLLITKNALIVTILIKETLGAEELGVNT